MPFSFIHRKFSKKQGVPPPHARIKLFLMANFLYNNFKTTLKPDEKQSVWFADEGFKGSMKNQLLKKDYIQDDF